MAAAGSRPKTPLSQTWSPCRAAATGALGQGFGLSRKWPQWEDAQQHLAPSELGSPPGTLPAFCPPCRGQVPWNWEDCSFYNCERSFVPTAAPVVAWKRAAVGICGTSAASRRRCSERAWQPQARCPGQPVFWCAAHQRPPPAVHCLACNAHTVDVGQCQLLAVGQCACPAPVTSRDGHVRFRGRSAAQPRHRHVSLPVPVRRQLEPSMGGW